MFHLTEAIRIERPAAEAWAMLVDFPSIPLWESGVLEVRQTSPGEAAVGTTLVARRVYAGRETNVDCRILDWQADRSVTMEILGGPTKRAVATYEVEPIGDDACQVTYTVDGEMRRGLGWLTPVIPRVGRGLVRTNLVSLGRRLEEAAAAAGARAAEVSPPDRASTRPS